MRRAPKILMAVILFGTAGAVAWMRFRPATPVTIAAAAVNRRPPLRRMAIQNPPLLSRLTPLPPVTLSDDNVAGLFPAFHHAPMESAGFNALALPFRYEDPNEVGDPAEANALAFLLSDALDWAPGNFSARHAYFVFAESGPDMSALARGYDGAVISQQIANWSATHAIGGVLRRTAAGCAGTLEVYAADGQLEYRKDYAEPRAYFDLLGDMAVDAIAHFGPPASPALVAHLHQARCGHVESIIRLGLAAFQPRQGARAFGLFDQILRDDPAFAEVRAWRANQKYWVDFDWAEEDPQFGRALHDRITPDALNWFEPVGCTDPQLALEYPSWVDRAERLGGADLPLVLYRRLKDAKEAGRFDPEVYRRAMAVAAGYPSARNLIDELADSLAINTAGPIDAELSSSLRADEIACRFLDGAGDHHRQWVGLATAAGMIGRPDVTVAAFEAAGQTTGAEVSYQRVEALCNAGRFADALDRFTRDESTDPGVDGTGIADVPASYWRATSARWAALAAVTVGDAKALARLRRAYALPFKDYGFDTVLDAYADAMAGRPVDHAFLQVVFPGSWDPHVTPAWATAAAQVDHALGRTAYRGRCWDRANSSPGTRLFWALCDQYERQSPTPGEGPAFYEALAWLHPDDPWVRQAVADARARATGVVDRAALDRETSAVAHALADFSPDELPTATATRGLIARRHSERDARPWIVAATIHRLLVGGRVAAAHEMALRFRHLAVDLRNGAVGAFASQLVARTLGG